MAVRFVYDKAIDAGFLRFGEGKSAETIPATDAINLDFDAEGRLIAIEILDVSKTAPTLLSAATRRAVAAE